jgi:predicted Zn-dependent peptidase
MGAGGDAHHAATAAAEMRETVAPSGIHVLSETIPGVRSASVGVWVRHGAAHESADMAGASHLLEHMVFKGTSRRSAREIALALEGLGGSLDAYTSREHTSYQARVLDEHFPVALDVLSDLVLHPLLRDQDLELEREVVLEEISMVEDTPDDLVFELHGEAMWKGHPYGRSILGSRERVSSMTARDLRTLHEGHYTGPNLVVAAAGNVRHEDLVERVEACFGDIAPRGRGADIHGLPEFEPGSSVVRRDLAQTHIVLARPCPPHSDPRRYALALLSAAFGGGMSSRLFQRIREELGLAYSVFSFQSFYSLGGVTGVYVGTRPEWADRAEGAVLEEMARLSREGLGREELEMVRNQVKGQIMLSLESTGARLHRLAHFALYREPFLTLDEVLSRIDAVSEGELRSVASEFWDPERQFSLRLGPG